MKFHPAHRLLMEHGIGEADSAKLIEFHRHSERRSFRYPWSELEDHLAAKGAGQVFLVGYGSLLNPSSAARTFPGTPASGHPPVVALGARRVFNYRIPDAVIQRYGQLPSGYDQAALNAEPMADGVFNGRLIELKIEDLAALRTRETGYDLSPMGCLDWTDPARPRIQAYALCCTHEYWEGQRYVDNALLPYGPYCAVCRAGAALVSEAFLRLFERTCYLADRKTTLFEWDGKTP